MRLGEADIEPAVGSTGDTLAEARGTNSALGRGKHTLHHSASFATTQYVPKKFKTHGDSGGEFRYTNHYEDKKIGTHSG